MNPATAPTEDDIVRSAVGGDEDALKILMTLLHTQVWRQIDRALPRKLRGRIDPEDVMQEAYLEVGRRIRGFKIGRHPFASYRLWVLKIVRSRLINEMKTHKTQGRDVSREVGIPDEQTGPERFLSEITREGVSPCRRASKAEAAACLLAALTVLPDDQRLAVCLRYGDGRSFGDIAEIMGKTTRAVEGLVRRGLEKLKELLGSYSNLVVSP